MSLPYNTKQCQMSLERANEVPCAFIPISPYCQILMQNIESFAFNEKKNDSIELPNKQ